jgi:hypothetical protein
MADNYAQSTAGHKPLTGLDKLEHSMTACEELLASIQSAKHPSAGRKKYLLGVRLANIRQQLKDISSGRAGI